MNRLELLHQFHQEDPSDPFNSYALALEYQNHDLAKALHYYKTLIESFPQYLPTYYHAAALFAELEQEDDAATLYQKGMELALQQHNTKTYQELQRAYKQMQE